MGLELLNGHPVLPHVTQIAPCSVVYLNNSIVGGRRELIFIRSLCLSFFFFLAKSHIPSIV